MAGGLLSCRLDSENALEGFVKTAGNFSEDKLKRTTSINQYSEPENSEFQ
ncbi:MAG: hypothetical protein WBI44_01365 [Syntrophaceticus sp.]